MMGETGVEPRSLEELMEAFFKSGYDPHLRKAITSHPEATASRLIALRDKYPNDNGAETWLCNGYIFLVDDICEMKNEKAATVEELRQLYNEDGEYHDALHRTLQCRMPGLKLEELIALTRQVLAIPAGLRGMGDKCLRRAAAESMNSSDLRVEELSLAISVLFNDFGEDDVADETITAFVDAIEILHKQSMPVRTVAEFKQMILEKSGQPDLTKFISQSVAHTHFLSRVNAFGDNILRLEAWKKNLPFSCFPDVPELNAIPLPPDIWDQLVRELDELLASQPT